MFLFRCCGRFSLEVALFSWWLITWRLWRRQIKLSSLRMERWWRRGHILSSWPREAATISIIKIAIFYKVELPSDIECPPPSGFGGLLWTNHWLSIALLLTMKLLFFLMKIPAPKLRRTHRKSLFSVRKPGRMYFYLAAAARPSFPSSTPPPFLLLQSLWVFLPLGSWWQHR